jgi:dephospho-CoA kinase
MPFLVGLTGGVGSGKSVVGRLFEQRGATLIDADAESHALTAPGGAALEPIRAAFGPRFIMEDGGLDRALMRERVFDDPAARARLEAILHPLIQSRCDRKILGAPGPYAIVMVPLLVESGNPRRQIHRIAVVDCREETQITRVMKRDHLPREIVLKIMTAQASREARLAEADDVIDNDGPVSALPPQVDALHHSYRRMAAGAQWPWPPSRSQSR